MSSSASSVSKGVFVFKGNKKVAYEEDYFGDKSNAKVAEERLLMCKGSWEKMDEQIQIMQSDLNTKIFDDLLTYIGQAHEGFSLSLDEASDENFRREVPTAALVTGVNMPDHDVMFNNLLTLFKENVTPLTAVLHAKDCPNVKAIMSKTISQLMENSDMLEDDAEEEESLNLRRVSGTMAVLAAWYRQRAQICQSPRKKRMDRSPTKAKSAGSPTKRLSAGSPTKRKSDGSPAKKLGGSPTKRKPAGSPSKKLDGSPRRKSEGSPTRRQQPVCPPVVFILEDFESFVPHVLQDFITICSNHLHELPVVLVFGIATTVTAVHRLLPQRVSSLLCMEKFQAPPSSDYLSEVIKQVVMTSRFPFKLSGKVFNLLLDIFLYHDFSVVGFVRGIQFCLLDHFYGGVNGVLCVPPADMETQVDALSSAEVDGVRSNASYRRLVESKPHKEQIALLEDDSHTKDLVVKCLSALDHYHQCFFPVITCLHVFTGRLPGSPLGGKIRQMYGLSLCCDICGTEEYKQCLLLLRTLSRDEMTDKLGRCVDILADDTCPDDLHEVKDKLNEFKDKFENIEALSKEIEETDDSETAPETSALPKKMDMYTLKQKLQEMDKKSKKLTAYEVIRGDTVSLLDTVFRKYLKCPSKFPLHEVYYYSNVSAVRHHLNGSPRSTIQNGLDNPHYYLQHEDLKCEGMSIAPTLPDLCIVYKLHAECGRLINLYDWLQAFVTVVTASDEDQDNISKKPDKLLQARFIRAVSELQFLGFIKPTKRKTDHVARLTWGGC